MRRPYFRGARQSLVVVCLVLCACSSDKTTPTTTISATTTTENVGTRVANLLLSACLTNMTPALFRINLAQIVRPDKVELFMGQYESAMAAC